MSFFFDRDRGAEIFIRAIGGWYGVLRPGEPSGLNPLQLSDTPVNRSFLRDWLATLVRPAAGCAPVGHGSDGHCRRDCLEL